MDVVLFCSDIAMFVLCKENSFTTRRKTISDQSMAWVTPQWLKTRVGNESKCKEFGVFISFNNKTCVVMNELIILLRL